VKRNATFVRKLAKITEDQKDKLAAEIVTLNTSKFIPEAVNAIAQELTVALKPTDINASVQICSLMHQRYAGDFAKHLIPALVKSYDSPGKTEADTVRKKRVVLRLLCELYLAGVYTDTSVLISILRDLVRAPRSRVTTYVVSASVAYGSPAVILVASGEHQRPGVQGRP
jgi:regulator of nonsense transcripts 2